MACAFTSSLLVSLLLNIVGVRACPGVHLLWEASEQKKGSLGRRELATIVATWWSVWLERNRRCFDDKKWELGLLRVEIRELRVLWSSFCV